MANSEENRPFYGELHFPDANSHDEDVAKACDVLENAMGEIGYSDDLGFWNPESDHRQAMKCLRALPELYHESENALERAREVVLSKAQEMAHAKMREEGLKGEDGKSGGDFWVFSDYCDGFLEELAPETHYWVLSEKTQVQLLKTMVRQMDAQRGFDCDSDAMDILTATMESFCGEENKAVLGQVILASGNPVYDRLCQMEQLFELPVPYDSLPFSAEEFRQGMNKLTSTDIDVVFQAYLWARKNLLGKRMEAGSAALLEFAKRMVTVIDTPKVENLLSLMNVSHFLAALEKVFMGWAPGEPYLTESDKAELLVALQSGAHPSLKGLHDRLG